MTKSAIEQISGWREDSERFQWLKQNVVFLHQGYGDRDPVDVARPIWNIQGGWTKEPNDRWYPSLEEAIDKERQFAALSPDKEKK